MKDSAVSITRQLGEGETYSRAKFLPAHAITPARIRDTKRRLLNQLNKVAIRAELDNYKLYTIHSFTEGYDVVVAGVIVRGKEEI